MLELHGATVYNAHWFSIYFYKYLRQDPESKERCAFFLRWEGNTDYYGKENEEEDETRNEEST